MCLLVGVESVVVTVVFVVFVEQFVLVHVLEWSALFPSRDIKKRETHLWQPTLCGYDFTRFSKRFASPK